MGDGGASGLRRRADTPSSLSFMPYVQCTIFILSTAAARRPERKLYLRYNVQGGTG
jgi:hypothetical protein